METTIKNLGNGLELVKEFLTNGKVLRKYHTLNGKRHGYELWYYESGQIERIVNWDNGELKSIIKYNEDGSLAI